MYGIRFVSDREIGFSLSKILLRESGDQYVWKVDCLWIEGPDGYDYTQVEGKMLSTKELKDAFHCLQDRFMMFGRMRRYVRGDEVDEIESFEDFENSKCSMIIFCVDVWECEIYGKSYEEIAMIFEDVSKVKEFKDLEIGNEEQIGRTCLTV